MAVPATSIISSATSVTISPLPVMVRLTTTSFLSQLHASPVPSIVRQAGRGDTFLPLHMMLRLRYSVVLTILRFPHFSIPVLVTLLVTMLLLVVFLLLPLPVLTLLLLLLSLLATFLPFLSLRVLLRRMSVQLEELLGIKFCEVGHKVPQVAPPVPGLVLGHILQQAVDVAPNLHQAATGV